MKGQARTAVADFSSASDVRPEVSCRICESSRFSPYLEAGSYRIVRCRNCGLCYVNPQPSNRELADFYSQFDRDNSWRGESEEGFDRAIKRLVLGFQPGGAVLDIGSSKGNFLISMRKAGYLVYGVEPSAKNADFARAVNRVPTHTGVVEDFLLSPVRQKFRVITLLNVLEHLRDPKRVLLGLRERLEDGGILVVVVPDARFHATAGEVRKKLGFSDPFWMENRKLVGFDPPQHLCSFEPRTISLLVEKCGFRRLSLRNAPVIFNRAPWRNVAKLSVYGIGKCLYWLSLGRMVVGYSTVLVAQKVSSGESV